MIQSQTSSKANKTYYNIPQIQADPAPDMPTIEMKKTENNQNKFSNESAVNVCNVEQEIFQYIYEGDLEKLKTLKIHLRDLNYLEEFMEDFIDKQIFPLALAVAMGNIDIVKVLLQNESIDINLQTEPQGLTCLKIACSNGFYELSELLVQKGADVNQASSDGSVALFYCFSRLEVQNNHFENKQLCFKLAELILENGGNIDTIVNEKKGYSLLMLFCSIKEKLSGRDLQDNIDVIKFLVKNGADKEIQSTKGMKAIDLCQKHPAKNTIIGLLSSANTEEKEQKKVLQYKPQPINQKQSIKLEGKNSNNNCCCSILSSSRLQKPIEKKEDKKWWDIF